jgi:hypothetical protein
MAGRFEPLHLPLSSACRLVRIFCSGVQPPVLAMLNPGHDIPLCRAAAGELVGDHDAWRPHLLLQQFAKEPLGRLLVAAALDEDVEHDAGLSTARHNQCFTPPILSTTSSRCHLSTDLVGELLAEFARPLPYSFVADDDATRGQQLLHHPEAKREAEIQPHGIADDLGREPVPAVTGASGRRHPSRLLTRASPRKGGKPAKLTMPSPVR